MHPSYGPSVVAVKGDLMDHSRLESAKSAVTSDRLMYLDDTALGRGSHRWSIRLSPSGHEASDIYQWQMGSISHRGAAGLSGVVLSA